ncbi:hypothetical protein [Pseudodesulfovibrio sp.]|uniref:hypothetical protein n=1 Tax=unclassified Pseudodesulfovibrio TaxID=2661612 RepID=UPI003AFFE6FF
MSIFSENCIKTILNVRVKILVPTLAVFGIILFIGGAYLISGPTTSRIAHSFSILITNVGGSIVASAIVGAFLIIYEILQNKTHLRCLSKLLEIDNIESAARDKKIAIILPRFNYENHIQTGDRIKNETERKCKASKDSRLTSRYSLGFDDIVAMRHISRTFTSRGLRPPFIVFDDDMYEELYTRGKAEYEAYISIGLFSNCVTMELASSVHASSERCFALSTRDELENNLRKIAICPSGRNPSEWISTPPCKWDTELGVDINAQPDVLETEDDFGLLAKCKTPQGKPCIIIGGAKARATRKLASYFFQSLENILILNDGHGENVNTNCFAAYYFLEGKRLNNLQRNDDYKLDMKRIKISNNSQAKKTK